MTILRVVTDINVGDFPTDETLEKVAESMRVYANGTVTGQVLQETDKVSFSHGHVHGPGGHHHHD